MANCQKKGVSPNQKNVIFVVKGIPPALCDALFFYTSHIPSDFADAFAFREQFDRNLQKGRIFKFETVCGPVMLQGVPTVPPGVKALDANSKLADLEQVFGVSPLSRRYRELLKTAAQWSLNVESLDEQASKLDTIFSSSEILWLQVAAKVQVSAMALRLMASEVVKKIVKTLGNEFSTIFSVVVNQVKKIIDKCLTVFENVDDLPQRIAALKAAFAACVRRMTIVIVDKALCIKELAGTSLASVNAALAMWCKTLPNGLMGAKIFDNLAFYKEAVVKLVSNIANAPSGVSGYVVIGKARCTQVVVRGMRSDLTLLDQKANVPVEKEGWSAVFDGKLSYVFKSGDCYYAAPLAGNVALSDVYCCERVVYLADGFTPEINDGLLLAALYTSNVAVDVLAALRKGKPFKFLGHSFVYVKNAAVSFTLAKGATVGDVLKLFVKEASDVWSTFDEKSHEFWTRAYNKCRDLTELVKTHYCKAQVTFVVLAVFLGSTIWELCKQVMFKVAGLFSAVVDFCKRAWDGFCEKLARVKLVISEVGCVLHGVKEHCFQLLFDALHALYKTFDKCAIGRIFAGNLLFWAGGVHKVDEDNSEVWFDAIDTVQVQDEGTIVENNVPDFVACPDVSIPERQKGYLVQIMADGKTYMFFRFQQDSNTYYAPMSQVGALNVVCRAGGKTVTFGDEEVTELPPPDVKMIYIDIECCGEPWTSIFKRVYKDPVEVETNLTVEELKSYVYGMMCDNLKLLPEAPQPPAYENVSIVDKKGQLLKVVDSCRLVYDEYDSDGAVSDDDYCSDSDVAEDDDEDVQEVDNDDDRLAGLLKNPVNFKYPLPYDDDYSVFCGQLVHRDAIDTYHHPSGDDMYVVNNSVEGAVKAIPQKVFDLMDDWGAAVDEQERRLNAEEPEVVVVRDVVILDVNKGSENVFQKLNTTLPENSESAVSNENAEVVLEESTVEVDIEEKTTPVQITIESHPDDVDIGEPTSSIDDSINHSAQENLEDQSPGDNHVQADVSGENDVVIDECAVEHAIEEQPQDFVLVESKKKTPKFKLKPTKCKPPKGLEFYTHVGELDLVIAKAMDLFEDFVLVNAANEHMAHGGGVAKAIADFCGPKFVEYCDAYVKKHGKQQQLLAPSGIANIQAVNNVVGPRQGQDDLFDKLVEAYERVLVPNAVNYALPILSVGIFGVDYKQSIDAMRKAFEGKNVRVLLFTLKQEHIEYFNASLKQKTVYLTEDGVSYKSLVLNPGDTFGHIGGVFARNKTIFSADDVVDKEVLFVPTKNKAVLDYYDLDAQKYALYLRTLAQKWEIFQKDNITQLVWRDGNCWVNSVVVLLQEAKIKFKGYLANAWAQFLGGDPTEFVAWCYASTNTQVGEFCDANLCLLNLAHHFDVDYTKAFIARRVTCKCGVNTQHVYGITACLQHVSATNMLNFMTQYGDCDKCGEKYVDEVTSINLPYLFMFVSGGPKVVERDNNVVANIVFLGSIESGHCYTQTQQGVFDNLVNNRKFSTKASYMTAYYTQVSCEKEVVVEASNSGVEVEDISDFERWYSENYYECLTVEDVLQVEDAIDFADSADSILPLTLPVRGIVNEINFKSLNGFTYILKPVSGDRCDVPVYYPTLDSVSLRAIWINGDNNYVVGHPNSYSRCLRIPTLYEEAEQFISVSDSVGNVTYGKWSAKQLNKPMLSSVITVIKNVIGITTPISTIVKETVTNTVRRSLNYNVVGNVTGSILGFVGDSFKRIRGKISFHLLKTILLFLFYFCKASFSRFTCNYRGVVTKVVMASFFLTWFLYTYSAMHFVGVKVLNFLFEGSLCNSYKDYGKETFNMLHYCGDDAVCRVCLHDVDSLHLYKHAYSIEQVYKNAVVQFNFTWNWFYFLFLLFFVKPVALFIIVCYCLKYLVLNADFLQTGISVFDWCLVTFFSNFNFMGAGFYVWVLWQIYKYAHHIIYCKDVTCDICRRVARNSRHEVSVVVNGRKQSVYVYTNSGFTFCNKHNWYCKDCDKFGHQNTFISPEVAGELSDKLKRHIKPTSHAYYVVDTAQLVDEGFVNFNYRSSEPGSGVQKPQVKCFTVAEFLKNAVFLKDAVKCDFIENNGFIVCNTQSLHDLEAAKNVAVYYAHYLCKPILILDQILYNTLATQPVSKNLVDKISGVLASIVSVNIENINYNAGSLRDALLSITDDEEAVDLAIFCHNYDIAYTQDGFTNIVPSYGIDVSKLTPRDKGFLVNADASIANLKVRNAPAVVWNYHDLCKLSGTCLKYLISATVKAGGKFYVTRSLVKQVITCHTEKLILEKKAGGVIKNTASYFYFVFKFLLVFYLIVSAGCVYYHANSGGFIHSMYDVNNTFPVDNYKVIENGVIRDIVSEDNCFSNKFSSFDNFWGRPYVNSRDCPIVTAIIEGAGIVAAGVPGHVQWVLDRTMFIHTTQIEIRPWYAPSWFPHDNVVGYTTDSIITQGEFYQSIATIPARCMYLASSGIQQLYCYGGENDAPGAISYESIQPHRVYLQSNGIRFSIPQQLLYTPYIVKLSSDNYCKGSVCEETKLGYCFSWTPRWVLYNEDYTGLPGVYCGSTIRELVFVMVNSFFTGVNPNMYLHLTTMFLVLVAVVFCFMIMIRFQGVFKAYASIVFSIITVWVVNVFMLCVYSYNPFVAIILVALYCYCSLMVSKNVAAIMHLWVIFTFVLVVPWWITCFYIVFAIYMYTPFVLWFYGTAKQTRKLYDGSEFVGTYDMAAQSTFVIRNVEFVKLSNEIGDKLDVYLSAYARLKYYSGTGGEQDYLHACRAWLAYALDQYRSSGVEVLYTPPKFSMGVSRLQAGFKKFVSPSSVVEKCVVMVRYRGNVLNGLWLNDSVYCPRHVMGKYSGTEWQDVLNLANNHEFEIVSSDGATLHVVSRKLQGAVLVLQTATVNVNTPKYKFVQAKCGDTFTIACSYNGNVVGLYPVTMRSNGTVKASFSCGSCGSVGYVMNRGVVHFCYMHHLELPNAIHTGTDFAGNFYGGFVDEEKAQRVEPDLLITNNIVAWLYAAIISVKENTITTPSWLEKVSVSVQDYNKWAADSGFTSFVDNVAINKLAALTSIDIGKILRTIIVKHTHWGQESIMGLYNFEDELTPESVFNQVGGVKLQSTFVKRTLSWFWSRTILALFLFVLSAMVLFTVVPYKYFIYVAIMLLVFVFLAAFTIKHVLAFLDTFLLPTLCTVMIGVCLEVPLVYNSYVQDFLRSLFISWYNPEVIDTVVPWLFTPIILYTTMKCIQGCCAINSLSTALIGVYQVFKLAFMAYTAWNTGHAYSAGNWELFFELLHTTVLANVSSNSIVGLLVFNVAKWCLNYCNLTYLNSYVLMAIFINVIGWLFTCYFGVYWWLNKVFGFTFGKYTFKVSVEQYKYMCVHKIPAPKTAWDIFSTNILIQGIGGDRKLPIATVQSKLTDVKCTAVVLMQLLTKLNVEANSKMHKHLVELHNKILASEDLVECMDHLLGMLVTLLCIDSTVDLSEYCEDVLSNVTVLQSVTQEFSHIPSYAEYERAKELYERVLAEFKNGNVTQQEVAAYRKAANIAKSVFDRDLSVQKKLDAMAERAMTTMYKEARVTDRRAKLVSSLHALLFSMLKKIDSDKLKSLFDQARDGVVPLATVPIVCSNKLTLVIPDANTWNKCVQGSYVTYSTVVWNIDSVLDADGVEQQPISDGQNLTYPVFGDKVAWPLKVNLVRNAHNKVDVSLQNNELMPQGVKTKACVAGVDQTSCNVESKCYYTNINGSTVVAAITSSNPNLKVASFLSDAGNQIFVDLDPPCKFGMKVGGKVEIVYLYFLKNTRSIIRGMVLGAISNVVVLQSKGHETEDVEAVGILSLCAFAVDPADTYLKYVAAGNQPLGNCVKMLTVHNGTGFAITTKPSPTSDQDSYGGASVCLYCRAHVAHPGSSGTLDGRCPFKGSFVQIPATEKDPVGFCLRNKICKVCQCWVGFGCQCDALRQPSMQVAYEEPNVSTNVDKNYLNGYGVAVRLD